MDGEKFTAERGCISAVFPPNTAVLLLHDERLETMMTGSKLNTRQRRPPSTYSCMSSRSVILTYLIIIHLFKKNAQGTIALSLLARSIAIELDEEASTGFPWPGLTSHGGGGVELGYKYGESPVAGAWPARTRWFWC